MKTKFLLLFISILCFIQIANAQSYPVVLKVVDQSMGQITNKVNDWNEQNIFTWLDDNLRALNPSKSATEWWWPMYSDNDFAAFTNGALVKTSDAWEWTLPLQAEPGTYKWNPHCKTNGWVPIRGNGSSAVMYYYEGDDEDNNLVFTVGEDGTISGSVSLIIPDPSKQEKVSFTLQVIDYSKGELSNAPGTWAEDANIIAWVTDEINPMFGIPTSDFWFYGFFEKEVNWNNSGTTVTYPDGKLLKDDDKWIWQATFEAIPGTYQWNPLNILEGLQSISGGNLTFHVNSAGELSGDYFVTLGGTGEKANLILQVDMSGITVSPDGLHVTGSFNNWASPENSPQLTDIDGDGIYTITLQVDKREEVYQYKFANGKTWDDAEVVFGNCAYRSNRIVWVTEDNVTLDPVVLGYCGNVAGISEIKVACIGDSNTEGAGVSDPMSKSWPIQMRDFLGGNYYTDNLGVSGATLMGFAEPWGAWTNNAQYEYNKLLDPNIVLVALGTNDSKTGGSYWGARDFEADYIALVNEFKAYPANPEVYMITPIKALANGFAISDDNIRNGVIPAINDLSAKYMLPVIDWYTTTSSFSFSDIPDGVHANEASSRIMAEKAAEILLMDKPVISLTGEGNSTYYGYRWYFNGQQVTGANNATYTATQTGNYNVAVKPVNGTDDVIISETFVLSGGTPVELKVGSSLTGLDPESTTNVDICYNAGVLTLTGCEGNEVVIYNMAGMIVRKVQVRNYTETLDISDLERGTYICKSANIVTKIIK